MERKIGDLVEFQSACWENSEGGTSADLRGKLRFRAKITKAWDDYETGWRYHAELQEDVEVEDDFTGPEILKKGAIVYVGQFDERRR